MFGVLEFPEMTRHLLFHILDSVMIALAPEFHPQHFEGHSGAEASVEPPVALHGKDAAMDTKSVPKKLDAWNTLHAS